MPLHTIGSARRAAVIGCASAAALIVCGCSSKTPPPSNAGTPTTAPATTTQASPSQPAATGGAGSPSAKPTGTPRCATADLSGTFAAVPGSAGAGNIVYNIKLVNSGSHPCTLYGHPGLRLLDSKHAPLPTNVQWNTMVPNTLITLAPGGAASASARFSPSVPGTGDATSGPCQPTSVYTQITPPNQTTQLVVAVVPTTSVCERGTMSVSAMVAGPTGPGQA